VTLTLANRRLGHFTVVSCKGRIVAGAECTALQKLLDGLLVPNPWVILHVAEVDFIDSSGLGLLVRYLTRARNAGGNFALCAASPKIREALRVTHLDRVLESYDSEGDAMSALYTRARTGGIASLKADVLCVERSSDLAAYMGGVLTQAGYGVVTAANLPDALILLLATEPKVVVISADLRAAMGTHTAHKFGRLLETRRVVELPADYSSQDAGEAGQRLLDQVGAAFGGGSVPAS